MEQGNNATIGPLVCSPLAVTPPAEDLHFSLFSIEPLAGGQMLSKTNTEPPTPDSLPSTESSRRLPRGRLPNPRPPIRQRFSASDAVFSTRNFQGHNNETDYLIIRFQQQSTRANGIVPRYILLYEQFWKLMNPKDRRHSRKQLKSSCSKLEDVRRQMTPPLERLRELQPELPSQQFWMHAQLHLERLQLISWLQVQLPHESPNQESWKPLQPHVEMLKHVSWMLAHRDGAAYLRGVSLDTATSYFTLPLTDFVRPPLPMKTILDGSAPGFIPRDTATDLSRSSGLTYLGTVDEDWDDFSTNQNLQFEYACKDNSNNNEVFDLWDGGLIQVQTRRLSLPNLKSVWPCDDGEEM